jgi:molecular chaperone GrpE
MTDDSPDRAAIDELADNAPDGADDPPSPAEALETLRRERDEFEDRWLRQTAEFDNYRKRIDRERRELAEYAASEVLLELLPILDDLERARAAAAASGDPVLDSHLEGLDLIHRQFMDMLRKRRVSPVETVGADFDPNVHQAVGQEPSGTHREGEVIEELRRGYRLGDRLLRPAMVRVATRG